MFGKINLENFTGLTTMPQKAASAWEATKEIVGAKYKPLLYCGTQVVKGKNYWFIAEQTLATAAPERRLVTIAINEFEGKYKVVSGSIEVIMG